MKKILIGLLFLLFIVTPALTVSACSRLFPADAGISLSEPSHNSHNITFTHRNGEVLKLDKWKIWSIAAPTLSHDLLTRIYWNSDIQSGLGPISVIPIPSSTPEWNESHSPLPLQFLEPVQETVPIAELEPQPMPAPEPAPEPLLTPEPKSDSLASFNAMQVEMLDYINDSRVELGLSPLLLDNDLCHGAALKSKDMAVNEYFSHTSPTYGSPFEMMDELGITYRVAGENIAKNFSVETAHEAFMNSSGHRANILNSNFKKAGLGFYQDGNYLYVTQWFTD